jgi:phosphonate transport system ATP-binding protein
MSLEHNVLLGGCRAYRGGRRSVRFPSEERAAALALLDELGLGHLWWKPAAAVSGGERQRTALARALFARTRAAPGGRTDCQPRRRHGRPPLRVVREHMRDGSTLIVLHDASWPSATPTASSTLGGRL